MGSSKAMTLCEESIKFRMSPPSAAFVRTYMVVMDGEPSGTQPLAPDSEEEPQLSPSDPHLGGRTQHQLQVNLGDTKLWQLMEDLCWDIVLREINTPPGTHQ